MNLTDKIDKETKALKDKLTNHRLYKSLSNVDDIRVFSEFHVFAVWDFMSLLKSLQTSLTCVDTPWLPNKNSNTARFINEIVLGEETDIDENGSYKSHYDIYIDAMKQLGADVHQIENFINYITQGSTVNEALMKANVDGVVSDFVNYTFSVIETNKVHLIASAFTFGREGLIADMFIEILNYSNSITNNSYNSMTYYFKRHIELDGDEHGPMSMKMIEELCNNDQSKINDVIMVAKESLEYRIRLWDRIADAIDKK